MAVPQNIEELAHQVRTAIYGRDVRESIASSMEATADVADWARSVAQAIIDGSFDEATLNTAIENKLTQLEQDYAPNLTALETEVTNARGTETNLGNRLENVDAQLAQKAKQDELYINVKNPPPPLVALKGDYNYVSGTGTDDTTALQALINYAANKIMTMGAGAEGLTLFFPVGAYRVTTTLDITNNKRVSLLGLGKTKSMLVKDFGTTPLIDFSGSNNNRINIDNMAICGPSGAVSGSVFYSSTGWNQIYIQNCWFSGYATLIEATNAGDFVFAHNTIEYVNRPFKIGNLNTISSDITISDNVFYANGPSGEGTRPNPFDFINCHRTIFKNNKIIYDSPLAAAVTLINVESCRNFLISGNTVFDKAGSTIPSRLIRVKNSQKVKILGNDLGRTLLNTIDIDGSKGVVISQNGLIGTTDKTYQPIIVTGSSEDITISENEFAQVDSVDYSNLVNTNDILLDSCRRVSVTNNKIRKIIYVQATSSRYFIQGNQRSEEGAEVYYYNPTPQYGAWKVGDIVYNASPTAGGYLGWVCITAGTPGTWKGFGLIQA